MLDWNWLKLTKLDLIWLCYIEFEWNLLMLHWIGLKFELIWSCYQNPWASARGPEVGALQRRRCVYFEQRHSSWKACEDIDCFPLTIVSLQHFIYCRLTLGDGVVDRGSYVWWRTSTSTSSSTRSSRAADSAAEERDKQRDEMMQNLIHNHQHILEILHVRVSYMFNLSNSI
jgi:hypothetical protein